MIYILRELPPACETSRPLKLIVPKWQSDPFFIAMEQISSRHHRGEAPLKAAAMKSITADTVRKQKPSLSNDFTVWSSSQKGHLATGRGGGREEGDRRPDEELKRPTEARPLDGDKPLA